MKILNLDHFDRVFIDQELYWINSIVMRVKVGSQPGPMVRKFTMIHQPALLAANRRQMSPFFRWHVSLFATADDNGWVTVGFQRLGTFNHWDEAQSQPPGASTVTQEPLPPARTLMVTLQWCLPAWAWGTAVNWSSDSLGFPVSSRITCSVLEGSTSRGIFHPSFQTFHLLSSWTGQLVFLFFLQRRPC